MMPLARFLPPVAGIPSPATTPTAMSPLSTKEFPHGTLVPAFRPDSHGRRAARGGHVVGNDCSQGPTLAARLQALAVHLPARMGRGVWPRFLHRSDRRGARSVSVSAK